MDGGIGTYERQQPPLTNKDPLYWNYHFPSSMLSEPLQSAVCNALWVARSAIKPENAKAIRPMKFLFSGVVTSEILDTRN